MSRPRRKWLGLVFQVVIGGGLLAAVIGFVLPRLFPEPIEINSDLSLSADTAIGNGREDCSLPKNILTNGYALEIACDRITSRDTAITSGFDRAKPGRDERDGSAGAAGTNGSGEAGQAGGAGAPGGAGVPGRTPSEVSIEANRVVGNLSIRLQGEIGGDGGNGGSGGSGGQGGQGSPSRAGDCINLLVGKICNCEAGPGHGGIGGRGGDAGAGGPGGIGGNGGSVRISIKEIDGILKVSTAGAAGGQAGIAGQPGSGAPGGAEGELHGSCKSAGRGGSGGPAGSAAPPGSVGEQGQPGPIKVKIAGSEQKIVTGSYSYPQTVGD